LEDSRLWFGKDGSSKPSIKSFLTEVKQGITPTTWWSHEDAGHNDEAKKELKALLTEGLPFQTPKPTRLIQKVAMLATSKEGGHIVLDFFAGSGTTGHAIVELNKRDGGNRRCILVQLPEPTNDERYPTIADITKERLRRAGKRIREENPMFAGDLGFRVFKLASSNIRAWEPDRENLAETLKASIEHLKTDRTEQDILFELLLKLGLDLCVPIETQKVEGAKKRAHEIHSIGGGSLLVCLSPAIPQADVEPLAHGLAAWHKALKPAGETTVVFRDSAFADDVAKTNLTAILHQYGLETVRSL
jgi:adenine-specific DNA-methyltransferase